MRVLICGGRDFGFDIQEWQFIDETLFRLNEDYKFTFVITGGAPGVDTFAHRILCKNKAGSGETNLPYRVYRPDWVRYGKAAGPIRNRRMLEEGKPDLVIVFPGGRGTANMVKQARAAGVDILEIEYND